MKIEQDYWTFLLFPQTLNHHLEINARYSASKDIWTLNSLYTAYMCYLQDMTNFLVCVCVCVNSRGRSSENDSVSAAGRNPNPLICSSESPASQLSRSLWHPCWPLASYPCPLMIATRETESYFQRKTRDEWKTSTVQESVMQRVWEGSSWRTVLWREI